MSVKYVRARELLAHLFKKYRISMQGVSRKLGRSDSFVRVYVKTKRMPNLSLTAEILDAIGYDLVAVNRETYEMIVIDPSPDELESST